MKYSRVGSISSLAVLGEITPRVKLRLNSCYRCKFFKKKNGGNWERLRYVHGQFIYLGLYAYHGSCWPDDLVRYMDFLFCFFSPAKENAEFWVRYWILPVFREWAGREKQLGVEGARRETESWRGKEGKKWVGGDIKRGGGTFCIVFLICGGSTFLSGFASSTKSFYFINK